MRGNSHVRFLGGGIVATLSCYPTVPIAHAARLRYTIDWCYFCSLRAAVMLANNRKSTIVIPEQLAQAGRYLDAQHVAPVSVASNTGRLT